MFTRYVFWEPCLSPHKSDFLEEVARLTGAEVVCIANSGIPADRRSLGWSCDEAAQGVITIVSPDRNQIERLVSAEISSSLHVFSGIRWFENIECGLSAVRRLRATFAIYSEPRDFLGLKGLLRYLHSLATETWLKKNVSFVLGIGRYGPSWFRSVGYDASSIYPFAYFVPSTFERDFISAQNGSPVSVGYVGRLTEEKGVRYLIEAILSLNGVARLTLIGDGDLKRELIKLSEARSEFFKWEGVKSIHEVQQSMADLDLLVLPSITVDDGWGVVISEALMQGCAVVASKYVGASIVLDRHENGVVVNPKNPKDISSAVLYLKEIGLLSASSRKDRSAWARERLDSKAGARYFMEIVEHRFLGGKRPDPFYI